MPPRRPPPWPKRSSPPSGREKWGGARGRSHCRADRTLLDAAVWARPPYLKHATAQKKNALVGEREFDVTKAYWITWYVVFMAQEQVAVGLVGYRVCGRAF